MSSDQQAQAGAATAPAKPKAREVGRIVTLETDGYQRVTPMGLLIAFDSAEQVREALRTGHVEFTFLE